MEANSTPDWVSTDSLLPNHTNYTATEDTGFDQAMLNQYGLYRAGVNLLNIQITVCCVIGLPSNVASMVTLLKLNQMRSSTFFLTLLAAVDFSVLFHKQLFSILVITLQFRVGDAACKFYIYVGSVLVHYSTWLVVALTVERFIAVLLPLRVAELCTMTKAKLTAAGILLVLALLDLPFAVGVRQFQLPGGRWYCGLSAEYAFLFSRWIWVDATIYLFLSWPTLLFCNVMIIIRLRKRASLKKRLTNTPHNLEEVRKQKSVTVMMITVSIVCFLLITPNAIFFIYEKYWDRSDNIEQYAIFTFISALVYFLSNLNHAINFWLYVISGHRFRGAFLALILCRDDRDSSKHLSSTK